MTPRGVEPDRGGGGSEPTGPEAGPSPQKPAGGSSGTGGKARRVSFTAAQLRINQRISQAAVRRVNALADRVARSDFRATTLVRHVPRDGGCGCPICCGIAPGSLTATAGAALAAAKAATVDRAAAAVAVRPAGVRQLAYSV